MPTYDYACAACGHRFERIQPMSEAPIKTCPKCRKPRVKRLISPGGGLLFKGSGFYITDYRSKGYRDKAKAEADKAKPKAETKPEPKKPEPKKPEPKKTP